MSQRHDAPGAAEHHYRRPTAGELVAIGARVELELTETEAEELVPAIDGLLGALELLHATRGSRSASRPPAAAIRAAAPAGTRIRTTRSSGCAMSEAQARACWQGKRSG